MRASRRVDARKGSNRVSRPAQNIYILQILQRSATFSLQRSTVPSLVFSSDTKKPAQLPLPSMPLPSGYGS